MSKAAAKKPTKPPGPTMVDPGNAYDPNAVKVFIRGIHVGYVRGTQAKALAADMDRRGESNRTGNYAIIGQLSHAQVEE